MPRKGPSGRKPPHPELHSQPVAEHIPGEPSEEPDPNDAFARRAAAAAEPGDARVYFAAAVIAIAAALIGGIYALA
ncbi:MAG TPA: hypothetical protein VHD34_03810 [Xanthobacteraceae bacterium]|nr:hypothetical protein [Xanthobacteraceae bacterium]